MREIPRQEKDEKETLRQKAKALRVDYEEHWIESLKAEGLIKEDDQLISEYFTEYDDRLFEYGTLLDSLLGGFDVFPMPEPDLDNSEQFLNLYIDLSGTTELDKEKMNLTAKLESKNKDMIVMFLGTERMRFLLYDLIVKKDGRDVLENRFKSAIRSIAKKLNVKPPESWRLYLGKSDGIEIYEEESIGGVDDEEIVREGLLKETAVNRNFSGAF